MTIRRDSDTAILDRFEQGAMLVDAEARVVFANRVAEAILADPGDLHLDQRRLAAGCAADTTSLRQLIAGTAQGGAGGSLVIARNEHPCLMLLVIPLKSEARSLVPERASAIVFIKDLEHAAKLSFTAFEQYFCLTRAQAGLAREIIKGDGVAAAAARLGICYATARTHLLQVYQKTGTARQAELVRLMLQWNEGPLVD